MYDQKDCSNGYDIDGSSFYTKSRLIKISIIKASRCAVHIDLRSRHSFLRLSMYARDKNYFIILPLINI